MKHFRKLLAAACLLAIAGTDGLEAKTYRIGTFVVPLLVEDQAHGIFVALFAEVLKRTGENCALAVYPTNRTLKLFQEGELDGFFPASEKNAGEKAAKSSSFFNKNTFIFVRQGAPYIHAAAELEGKKLGLTKGYTYSAELTSNPKILVEYADSDVINMRKLSQGRIDAVAAEERSGQQAIAESGATNLGYDPAKPYHTLPIFFAFQDTAEGRALAAKFSQALTHMQADGTFEKIMGKAQ